MAESDASVAAAATAHDVLRDEARPHLHLLPEVGLAELEVADEEVVEVVAIRHPWRRKWLAIGVFLVIGIAMIVISLAVMTDITAEWRLLVGGLGLAGVATAVDGAAKRWWGQKFATFQWFAVVWLMFVVVVAIIADWLPLAESKNPSLTFSEPTLASPDLWSHHPFGTDRQGLDVLGGIFYGFRVSLVVGLGTVAIGLLVGGAIGIIAGYYRGKVDRGIELLTNSMLAFPPLILLLAVAAVMERNVRNITFALAIVSIPTFVRLARANTMVVSQKEFVLAARALGAKNRHIMVRDIAPGVLRPLASYAFVVVAVIMVAEASLSFLGLGIPRPQPTLGNMIAAGQTEFEKHPHLVFLPAAALFLTVLCLNRVGEAAQQRWNQREQKI